MMPQSAQCPLASAPLWPEAMLAARTGSEEPGFCSAGAAAFNPFGEAYQQDPPEYLRWAREQKPVFYSPQLGYWVVTRYDDIQAVFRDNQVFSPSIALEKITQTGPEANAVLASYGYAMNRTLVNEDEPAHQPRRRLLMEPFTPAQLAQQEPMVRQLVRAYVDHFIDDGRADLVDQMLWEVPLTVALHFLGVPEEDRDTLRRYSIAHTVNTWGRPRPEEQVAVAHAVGHFWQLAGQILEKMRQDPEAPGWMQYGIRMQRKYPEIVTDSYLHSMMMAGIVAAHETTANATANSLKLLLQHPRDWQALCANPGLIPNAVEECLRHNGSVAAWRRLAMRDSQIGGMKIPAGSRLLLVTASANHDEHHFSDADFFDIQRGNAAEHLTFGYGSHQCMGKNLARMEIQIMLAEFSRRLPHMRLAEQRFTYVPNTSFRGPEHLWVEWNPTENPERRNPGIRVQTIPVALGQAVERKPTHTVIVTAMTPIATDVLKFTLTAPAGQALPPWAPGAHIEVLCGQTGLARQYSLCGDPHDRQRWEIAVLREPNSRGGSDWVHTRLQTGAELAVRGPRNHFSFDENARQVVLIAGGIGITPICTMARRAQRLEIDYTLHYAGRSRCTMAFLDELRAQHGERLQLHVSDEGGRLDFRAWVIDAATRVYACGPARLLAALQTQAVHWPAGAVRVEHFTSQRQALDPTKEHAFELALHESGITVPVSVQQTVLEALRGIGVDLPSSCEEGLCGTCELQVLAGEIDHRDQVLAPAERAAQNRMMACCSRAAGKKLVVAL